MHLATLHLAPVLAAEKSKVPFYIAGGVLVVWALVISLALGMRRPEFPGGQKGENLIIAVSSRARPDHRRDGGDHLEPALEGRGLEHRAVDVDAVRARHIRSAAPAVPPLRPPEPRALPKPRPARPRRPPLRPPCTKLALAANPEGQLSYNTKQLNAKAGSVTITMTNMSPVEHDVTISSGSNVLGATPTFIKGTKTLTLTLKAGTYTFYCSVPGHRQAGMEGTLTVSS